MGVDTTDIHNSVHNSVNSSFVTDNLANSTVFASVNGEELNTSAQLPIPPQYLYPQVFPQPIVPPSHFVSYETPTLAPVDIAELKLRRAICHLRGSLFFSLFYVLLTSLIFWPGFFWIGTGLIINSLIGAIALATRCRLVHFVHFFTCIAFAIFLTWIIAVVHFFFIVPYIITWWSAIETVKVAQLLALVKKLRSELP